MIFNMNMKNKIILFLKGFLMGICDLIPGISGGTIAFITGIYARLIEAVKSFSPKLVYDFFAYVFGGGEEKWKNFKEDIVKLDLVFLLTLFLGIGVAFLVGSRAIKFLLENHLAYTLAFFVGFILASAKIIFDDIKNHNITNILFGLVGFIVGILLAVLIPSNITPTLGYVFVGGFVAISAMFLPGISGAFILLIMGLYEFMINVLHDVSGNMNYFLIFVLGAILGAFVISRVISYLFRKDRCKTLYMLLGLVIGALSIPIREIFENISLDVWNVFVVLIFLVVGVLLVGLITKYGKKKIIESS